MMGFLILLSLHQIQTSIGDSKHVLEAAAVVRTFGQPEAHGNRRLFTVASYGGRNSVRQMLRVIYRCFRKDYREFIAPITSGNVQAPALRPQNIAHTADGAAAYHMAMGIVDSLESVEIQ